MKKLFAVIVLAFAVAGCVPADSTSSTSESMQCKCCKEMKECCCKGMMKNNTAKKDVMACCCKGIMSDDMGMGNAKGDRPMCNKMKSSTVAPSVSSGNHGTGH